MIVVFFAAGSSPVAVWLSIQGPSGGGRVALSAFQAFLPAVWAAQLLKNARSCQVLLTSRGRRVGHRPGAAWAFSGTCCVTIYTDLTKGRLRNPCLKADASRVYPGALGGREGGSQWISGLSVSLLGDFCWNKPVVWVWLCSITEPVNSWVKVGRLSSHWTVGFIFLKFFLTDWIFPRSH